MLPTIFINFFTCNFTVTFYNGLTTIGGPMIEVAYNDSHILFDLGEVYRPELKLSMEDEDFETLIKYQFLIFSCNYFPGITFVMSCSR